MSDLEIQIGGRNFMVACQPGEEQFLMSAAAMLDAEAQPLVAQMGAETLALALEITRLTDELAAARVRDPPVQYRRCAR